MSPAKGRNPVPEYAKGRQGVMNQGFVKAWNRINVVAPRLIPQFRSSIAGVGGLIGVGNQFLVDGVGNVGMPVIGGAGDEDGSEKNEGDDSGHGEWRNGTAKARQRGPLGRGKLRRHRVQRGRGRARARIAVLLLPGRKRCTPCRRCTQRSESLPACRRAKTPGTHARTGRSRCRLRVAANFERAQQ